MKLSAFVSVPLLFALTACPSDPPGSGADAGPEPTECQSTDQCPVDTTCDISQGICVDDVSCTTHAECGVAAFCNGSSQCERSITGAPCDSKDDCYAGDGCFHGYCGCAGEQFEAEAIPPNVLVVLDRSGSMNESAGGGQTKWQVAVASVNQLIADYNDNIRFGLVLYSADGGDNCSPGSVSVETGAGNGAAITAALAATGPGGNTPIGATLDALASYAGLEDDSRDNFIVLLTDGKETCNGDGTPAVTALRAKSTSVQTFVVGFGDGVDASALNAMAVAGGTAQGAGTDYYQADNAASLQGAFDAIAADVLSCGYDLDEAPTNASELIVYLDGAAIDEDASRQDGWTYDAVANRLDFHGGACTKLRAASKKKLNVVRSCPFIVP